LGQVTAVGAGTTRVTAAATSGGVTKQGNSAVTVQVAPDAATATAPQVAFTPQHVDVGAGGTVTWLMGAVTHNVDFSMAGSPADIGDTQSASDSRVFPSSGTSAYVCSLHSGMNGTVRVH
jgi:plastocyanin